MWYDYDEEGFSPRNVAIGICNGGGEAGQRASSNVATKIAPAVFLPLIMKQGTNNQMWVQTDKGIIYLDLFLGDCSTEGTCTVNKG